MADDRTIVITARINRRVWFGFRELMGSSGVPANAGVELALRAVLERAGVVDALAPLERSAMAVRCERAEETAPSK
jgi:hypothetical protein